MSDCALADQRRAFARTSRPGRPDGFGLSTAVDLARLAPSAALWEPLQKLDPNRPRVTSTQEFLLGAMLEIGVALARLISINAEPGASVVVIEQPDGSSEERCLDANRDAYREWYLPPYVIVVQRVGQTITLRFTPATRAPAMDPAAAYDMAKAICDRRGKMGEVVQDPQDYDGLYTYELKGGARPCKIRIGTRTRRGITGTLLALFLIVVIVLRSR